MSAPSDSLKRISERAAWEPFFLAGALMSYKDENGLDDAALAAYLGCAVDDLPRLSLCRRPSEGAFMKDISHLATRFRLNGGRLAALIRHVEVLEDLRATGVPASMAARDREDEDGE